MQSHQNTARAKCRLDPNKNPSTTLADRNRVPGQQLSSAGAATPLARGLRGPQVLLIDGFKAMVVLHACQRSIKISNDFRIIMMLVECQIARDFGDLWRKFLYLVQGPLLRGGFKNDVSVTYRQIDSFQDKHTNKAVDVVRFHNRRPHAGLERAVDLVAITRAPDGSDSKTSQLTHVAAKLEIRIGRDKKSFNLGYDREARIGEKLISFRQLENRKYPVGATAANLRQATCPGHELNFKLMARSPEGFGHDIDKDSRWSASLHVGRGGAVSSHENKRPGISIAAARCRYRNGKQERSQGTRRFSCILDAHTSHHVELSRSGLSRKSESCVRPAGQIRTLSKSQISDVSI